MSLSVAKEIVCPISVAETAKATELAERLRSGKVAEAIELMIAQGEKAVGELWLGQCVELLTQDKGFAIVRRKRSRKGVALEHLLGKGFEIAIEQGGAELIVTLLRTATRTMSDDGKEQLGERAVGLLITEVTAYEMGKTDEETRIGLCRQKSVGSIRLGILEKGFAKLSRLTKAEGCECRKLACGIMLVTGHAQDIVISPFIGKSCGMQGTMEALVGIAQTNRHDAEQDKDKEIGPQVGGKRRMFLAGVGYPSG